MPQEALGLLECKGLVALIEARLGERRITLNLALDPADGAGASWLHRHTEVLAKVLSDDAKQMNFTVRVDPTKADLVRSKFGVGRDARGGDGALLILLRAENEH